MLICLEAQAVTAADLGQEHNILACLDFCLVLSLVEIPAAAAVAAYTGLPLLVIFFISLVYGYYLCQWNEVNWRRL